MNKEKIKPLFGFPIYHSSIDKKLYNKQKILKTILSKFKKPDYNSLIPLYTSEIKNFFESMPMKKCNFKFEIVNYTCMTEGHHMMNHIHTECDFSAIHYVQFNDKTQDSTVFTNTND